MYSYKLVDLKKFFTEISGTRATYTVDELEQQLRNLVVATMSATLGGGAELPFLDMAANQLLLAERACRPAWPLPSTATAWRWTTSRSRTSPAQRAAEGHRHPHPGMGMVGDLGMCHPVPGGHLVFPWRPRTKGAWPAWGGAGGGVGMGQVMMTPCVGSQVPAAVPATAAVAAPAPGGAVAADDPEARLAKLKSLLDKGLVTQADSHDSAKAEILKKLIG